MEEPLSPGPSPKIQIYASGGRLRFILKSHHHHPTDCTCASQIPPGRAGSGRPTAFQSPSVHVKDTSKTREIHSGERRWCVVGCSGRNSHLPVLISKELTRVPRSDPSSPRSHGIRRARMELSMGAASDRQSSRRFLGTVTSTVVFLFRTRSRILRSEREV